MQPYTIKSLNDTTYELANDKYDHHIRLENGEWRVDTFEAAIDKADLAYIDSASFSDVVMENALLTALKYCLEFEA